MAYEDGSRSWHVRLRAFRRCLTRNEIFFKTITATLLSIMALAVAISQALTASEQKGIAKEQRDVAVQQKELALLQTRIAEANALPKFVLRIHQEMNPATLHADENYLLIENNGGDVHEFESHAAYFLTVEIGIPKGVEGKNAFFNGKAEFPVSGYFGIQMATGSGAGTLTTMTGHRNNAMVANIMQDARRIANEKGWAYANVDEHIFIYLQYLDLLDRFHDAYDEVAGARGGFRIDPAKGKGIFDRWNNFANRLGLETLSAETLIINTQCDLLSNKQGATCRSR